MATEIKDEEINEVAGGKAVNGKYYNYVSNGWTPYQIKSGDILINLAATHGTTVNMICQINPLIDDPNKILAGFWILLP